MKIYQKNQLALGEGAIDMFAPPPWPRMGHAAPAFPPLPPPLVVFHLNWLQVRVERMEAELLCDIIIFMWDKYKEPFKKILANPHISF